MLLAAACGGEEPSLANELAEQLAARSDAVGDRVDSEEFCAAGDAAAALQTHAIGAINSGGVPPELQEELLGSVNALLEAISCAPPGADDSAAADARSLADWLRERSD